MTEGVIDQETAAPELREVNPRPVVSDKELNFRRLEEAREEDRQRAFKAEMESALLKQRLEMLEKTTSPRESDPLEGVEDFVDPARYKADQARREVRLKKEAEEIAERKFREYQQKNKQETHEDTLRNKYSDYDQVMTKENIMQFQETNPEFIKSLQYINDDTERKTLAYQFFKRNMKPKEDLRQAIKDKVRDNAANPVMIGAGSGTPASSTDAIDFDVSSPQARATAYAKLKAAQRRPIVNSPPR